MGTPEAAHGMAWGSKNRCKDGRYYWVDAFVTPIYEHNQLVGYQSVRRQLDPKVRARAEMAYQALRQSKPVKSRLVISNQLKLVLVALCSVAITAGSILHSAYLSLLFPVLSSLCFTTSWWFIRTLTNNFSVNTTVCLVGFSAPIRPIKPSFIC